MTYYFVDYENVHSDGIVDCTELEPGDIVYVFYTEQAKNITLDILEQFTRKGIRLELDKAGTGAKNALDFQLSSYLGYVIAKHEKENIRYVIVSRDTGFDRLVQFWGEKGIEILRMPGLSRKEEPAKKTKTAAKTKSKGKSGRKGKAAREESRETEEQAALKAQEKEQPAEKPKTEETPEQAAQEKPRKAKKTSGTKGKIPVRTKKASDMQTITREEVLQYLAEEEYSDEILEILNSFKTKQAINNGLSKKYRDNKKSSEIYKKLRPLMKEKKKS